MTDTLTQENTYMSAYEIYCDRNGITPDYSTDKPIPEDAMEAIIDSIDFDGGMFGWSNENALKQLLRDANEASPMARLLIKQLDPNFTIDSSETLESAGAFKLSSPNAIFINENNVDKARSTYNDTAEMLTTLFHEVGHRQEHRCIRNFDGTEFLYDGESLELAPTKTMNLDQTIACDKLSEAEKYAQDLQLNYEVSNGDPYYTYLFEKNYDSLKSNPRYKDNPTALHLTATQMTMSQVITEFMGSPNNLKKHILSEETTTQLNNKLKTLNKTDKDAQAIQLKLDKSNFYKGLFVRSLLYTKQAIDNSTCAHLDNAFGKGDPQRMSAIGEAFSNKYGGFLDPQKITRCYPKEGQSVIFQGNKATMVKNQDLYSFAQEAYRQQNDYASNYFADKVKELFDSHTTIDAPIPPQGRSTKPSRTTNQPSAPRVPNKTSTTTQTTRTSGSKISAPRVPNSTSSSKTSKVSGKPSAPRVPTRTEQQTATRGQSKGSRIPNRGRGGK